MAKKDTTSPVIPGEWHLIDAKGAVLGRLATKVATLLQGKHHPDWAPNRLASVYVVIVNTDKVVLTGNKEEDKMYYHFTGYTGGLKQRNVKTQRALDSRQIIWHAVSGMLPKNKLRDQMREHLKLYTGAEHPHMAQISNPKSKD